jgi:ketosteroid isomerase-like protein
MNYLTLPEAERNSDSMKRLVMILWVAALALIVTGCGGGGRPTDPAGVMDAYTDAINAGDVELALSYVAEDAVYDRPGGQFVGKAEVRGFVEDLIARNVEVELIGERAVDGDTVTWTSHVTIDDPENPGTRLDLTNNSLSVVQNGLIVQHTAQRADQ